MSAEDFAELAKDAILRTLSEDDMLWRQGSRAMEYHIIVSGEVNIWRHAESGEGGGEMEMGMGGAGDGDGEGGGRRGNRIDVLGTGMGLGWAGLVPGEEHVRRGKREERERQRERERERA